MILTRGICRLCRVTEGRTLRKRVGCSVARCERLYLLYAHGCIDHKQLLSTLLVRVDTEVTHPRIAKHMSSIATYRVVTLVAAAGSSVLSASTLAFLVTALVSFRAEDLFTASKIEDFTTLGTCVETLTYEQLSDLDYTGDKIECEKILSLDNREKLANTLAATVHGVYYMHHTRHRDVLGTDFWGDRGVVMLAQLTHVLGKQFGSADEQAELVNVGINSTTAFEVLREVSQGIVPVSCDEIYSPYTFQTLSENLTLVDYVDDIRKGRLDGDDKVKSTWPLADFVTTCKEKVQPEGVGFFVSTWNRVVTDDMKKYLHAHCVAQFQYASVGSGSSGDGTFGIPLPGIVAGPSWNIQQIAHFNSTSTYNEKARMYIGQRFGMSVWAYVPMILCTCYLLGDSLVFFLAEALMPIGRASAIHSSASDRAYLVDSLLISASSSGSRKRRFGIGFIAVLSSLVFYTVFIVSAWGFMSQKMPRPECESRNYTDTDTNAGTTSNIEVGAAPDHGVVHIYWKGTVGGWKADYDASWYEIAALITQVLVLFLLPVTTWKLCARCNKAVDKPSPGTGTQVVGEALEVTAWTTRKFRTHQTKLIPLLMLGIVIIILGQSISGANFGVAWADGVMGRRKDVNGEPLFDERVLAENVYDQTIATLSLVVSCGLVFAVIMQRYLVAGVGCFNTSLFFMWVGLVFVLSLPIAVYAANRSIFSESKANEECSAFPRSSHETEDNLCVMRFWSLVVGGGIFYGTVGYVTLSGLAEALPKLAFATYFRQRVTQAKVGALATLLNSRENGTAPVVSSSSYYHSETEPFFNAVIKNDASSKNFFGGGKLWVPQAHK